MASPDRHDHGRETREERRDPPRPRRGAEPAGARRRDALAPSARCPPSVNHSYRICVGVVGGLIVALGLVTIPLPGPGWLTVIAGLFVLASEFTWAERLLEFTKKHVKRWTDWVTHQALWVRLVIAVGHGGLRLRGSSWSPSTSPVCPTGCQGGPLWR